ncbi:hypothetical protein, partial [Microbacterium aurugineum]|uniref:hypothetical protein n=1 Tax=Microbacterium aurugineum TaxID=2851642 RepID=UPI0039BE8BDE
IVILAVVAVCLAAPAEKVEKRDILMYEHDPLYRSLYPFSRSYYGYGLRRYYDPAAGGLVYPTIPRSSYIMY